MNRDIVASILFLLVVGLLDRGITAYGLSLEPWDVAPAYVEMRPWESGVNPDGSTFNRTGGSVIRNETWFMEGNPLGSKVLGWGGVALDVGLVSGVGLLVSMFYRLCADPRRRLILWGLLGFGLMRLAIVVNNFILVLGAPR